MTESPVIVSQLITVPPANGNWNALVPTMTDDEPTLVDDALAFSVRATEVDLSTTAELVDLCRRLEVHRVKTTLEVGLAPHSPSNLVTGFDGEVEGVFAATHEHLSIGDRVELLIHLPAEHGVLVAARVEWIRETGTYDAPVGVGLRFERLEHHERELLGTFASHREPLFYAA